MFNYGDHEDFRPVCYIRGYPLYVSGLLVLIHVAAFVATAVLLGLHQAGLLAAMTFQPQLFFTGWVWELFTYPLVKVNQMATPFSGIWFLVEMALLFTVGREIERYMGRWNLLNLYTWMIIIPAVVASVFWLMGVRGQLAGSFLVHAGILFAFAMIYPGLAFWGGIPAKWLAIGIGGVWSFIFLAQNDWIYLIGLWANAGYVFWATTRYRQGGEIHFWPDLRGWLKRPHVRVLPDPEREPAKMHQKSQRTPAERGGRMARGSGVSHVVEESGEDPRVQLDMLLDKIAAHGIGSLTGAERRRLERLREQLLEQESVREERP